MIQNFTRIFLKATTNRKKGKSNYIKTDNMYVPTEKNIILNNRIIISSADTVNRNKLTFIIHNTSWKIKISYNMRTQLHH